MTVETHPIPAGSVHLRPIDLAHLARYTGGDAALNAEVLNLFDVQTDELVARLKRVLELRDQKSWKEVTHTIKGAARGVGAFGLADAAAAAEGLDLSRNGPEARAAVDALADSARVVRCFIRAYLAA